MQLPTLPPRSLELTIGNTVIPYAVRESDQARRMKIVVTPPVQAIAKATEGATVEAMGEAMVEVVVPVGTPFDGARGIDAYLARKRRWIFDAVRQIHNAHREALHQHYLSGAKFQFGGRELMLDVQPGEVDTVRITCATKFEVVVPKDLDPEARIAAIRLAFDQFLRTEAERMMKEMGATHASSLGLEPTGYRLSETKGRWGSCGRDGIIRIHPRLAQAPKPAFEYVVAHEVTHLAHRNHGPQFWTTLGHTLPDWAERKTLLERWEAEHRAV
jgi:predicted metal-dependent hydrolase